MIILDTNVVSEPMRSQADPLVQTWLNKQAKETLYLTSTSLSELLLGVALLPEGKRKQGLGHALEQLLEHLFGNRIVSFDKQAARIYASLVATARAKGLTLSVSDAQIAAIASVYGFVVATRDEQPFTATGIKMINPWQKSKWK